MFPNDEVDRIFEHLNKIGVFNSASISEPISCKIPVEPRVRETWSLPHAL